MKRPTYILSLSIATLLYACAGPLIEETEKNGDPLHIRDSVAIIHEGTYASPYSVGEAQTLRHGDAVWIEGYIVGCVKGSMKNGCNYTAEATTASNIILADTFPTGTTYDYLYCLPIELPNNSIEREELNLYDNPELYHSKLRIQGDLSLYYSVVGIKRIYDYSIQNGCDSDNNEEAENSDDNRQDTVATNSKEYPLSISQGIALQDEDSYNQVWIKGYIVGYTTSNNIIYSDLTDKKKAAKENVVLADNPGEKDSERMIAVKLTPDDSYICTAVNLYDNPQNLHKKLTVKGRMAPFRDMSGCIDIPNGVISGDTIETDYFFRIED